jgi:hypothetical protein
MSRHEVARGVAKANSDQLTDGTDSKNPGTTESALLLIDNDESRQDRCVAKIIKFFGVPMRTVAAADFCCATAIATSTCAKPSLLGSADAFLRVLKAREQKHDGEAWWTQHIHSAFVYRSDNAASFASLATTLIGASASILRSSDADAGDFLVSDELNDVCGVMAGVRIKANKFNTNGNFVLTTGKTNRGNVIAFGDGAAFFEVDYKGVPIFCSTCSEIVDLDGQLKSQNFDVRDHFLSAVPLVLYIRWAFGKACWNAPEANACLVIDDPVLKPKHGFLDFQELLSLMKRHRFCTNIAFIPWNWRRSSPEVVRLFKENPENYSLSVHGCDHTRAEFGSTDCQHLYSKIQQALERMNCHESLTGIRHDEVVVFPQGIFSEAAMSMLKHTDLIAAVNNDVTSVDPHPRGIAISEVWDTAVMRYSNFPLFTRRYPWEGIENFAFDALLGKPAIIIIHHDYCSDHCRRLVGFVDRLNALRCRLTWRSLADVVRRSCRQRQLSSEVMEVEMYGTELELENPTEGRKRFIVRRRESDILSINEIRTGSGQIGWNSGEGQITFDIHLNPGESTAVRIKFHDLRAHEKSRESLSYQVKTTLRRYLCEIRDNYVTPARLWLHGHIGS